MAGPTAVAVHTQMPESWALAELDAALSDMTATELHVTFTMAGAAYAQALQSGGTPELVDVLQAAVRDAAPL